MSSIIPVVDVLSKCSKIHRYSGPPSHGDDAGTSRYAAETSNRICHVTGGDHWCQNDAAALPLRQQQQHELALHKLDALQNKHPLSAITSLCTGDSPAIVGDGSCLQQVDIFAATLQEVTVVARLVDKALVDRHSLSPQTAASGIASPEGGPMCRRRYQRRNSFVVHRNMGLQLPGFPSLHTTDVSTKSVTTGGSERQKREREHSRIDGNNSQQTKAARAG
jgi:hypothetical protein